MILGIVLTVIGGIGLIVFLTAIMIVTGMKWKEMLLIWGFMAVITILSISLSVGLSLIQFGKLVW